MKAVVWHGDEDVRVDTVDDRGSRSRRTRSSGSPRPRSAAPTCTSTRCSGGMKSGDIIGHEPMGIVEEVGAAVTELKAGDRVVLPFNISCGTCWMCGQGLYSQCETTQNTEAKKGAASTATRTCTAASPAARPSTSPPGRRRSARSWCRRTARTSATSSSPTCFRPPGRRSTYADTPRGGTLAVFGLGPIGQMCVSIARHQGVERIVALDHLPERLRLAERYGAETLDSSEVDEPPEAIKELTGGRGADAVIDAVGMESEGSVARPRRRPVPEAEARPPRRAARFDLVGPPRRHALDHRRLPRPRSAVAARRDLRPAAADPDGPGERAPVDGRDPAAPDRRGPARRHGPDDAQAALEEAPQAYEMFQKKEDGAIKVVLKP